MASLFESPSSGPDADEQKYYQIQAEQRAAAEADRQRRENEAVTAKQLADQRKAEADAVAAAEAKALEEEQKKKAEEAAAAEKENIKKRKGGASATIATGPEGILETAPTAIKSLLG